MTERPARPCGPGGFLADARTIARVALVGVLGLASISPALAQAAPADRPWWLGLDLGYGRATLSSDRVDGEGEGATFFALRGGRMLGRRARIGLEVSGWLLQSHNTNDPARGEAISNVLLHVDAFPFRERPFFARAGAGYARYNNDRPEGFDSSGWSWTLGVGYEVNLGERLVLVPALAWSAGDLGDVSNPVFVDRNRKFSAWDLRVGLGWRLGKAAP